jgi:hypothetical protein
MYALLVNDNRINGVSPVRTINFDTPYLAFMYYEQHLQHELLKGDNKIEHYVIAIVRIYENAKR